MARILILEDDPFRIAEFVQGLQGHDLTIVNRAIAASNLLRTELFAVAKVPLRGGLPFLGDFWTPKRVWQREHGGNWPRKRDSGLILIDSSSIAILISNTQTPVETV